VTGRRRAGWIGAALLATALVWVGAPYTLRHVRFFRVREIELVGLRNLAPDAVLAALRLDSTASAFDDLSAPAERVRRLHGVSDARVQRRLPGALRVIVREVEPAAFVPGPHGMVVVDAAGRPLPFDPTRAGLDLPIAATPDSGVVGVLALMQAVEPPLFEEVTAARSYGRGDVLVAWGARRVLLRRDAGPEVIRAVVLVAQDLAARERPYVELDARYAGQVVVRRRRST